MSTVNRECQQLGSPNSLHPELFATGRCIEMEIFSMTKELIYNLPQLQDLLVSIKRTNLDDVVWKVLGGLPSKYEHLNSILKENMGEQG